MFLVYSEPALLNESWILAQDEILGWVEWVCGRMSLTQSPVGGQSRKAQSSNSTSQRGSQVTYIYDLEKPDEKLSTLWFECYLNAFPVPAGT